MYVALYILAIVFVIMFHEFGHFATAKAFGMKVEKFFLGFGPTVWSFRRGETEYGVKGIPAGGFVKITGQSQHEDIDPDDEPRAFYAQPAWQRAIVLVAGSVTHFIVAAALIYAGLAVVGFERATNVIDDVVEGTPAAQAGLGSGDEIVSVAGTATQDFEAVSEQVAARPGETVEVGYVPAGAQQTRSVDVDLAPTNPAGEAIGFLGVRPSGEEVRLGPVEAVGETFTGEYSLPWVTRVTLQGLGEAFSPTALSDFFAQVGSDEPRSASDGGPASLIGAGAVVNTAGQEGNIIGVLTLLASLNVVLGVLNLLPLPPLDGGHLATLAIEESVNGVRRLRGRDATWTLDPRVVAPVAIAVILFFAVVSFTALYLDIVSPFTEVSQ